MISPQLARSGRGVAGGAFFSDGMQSASDPMFISDRAYRHGENVLHRGGSPRTRPGYRQVFTLPTGKYQGCTYFRPIQGDGMLVFAVAGKLYTSIFPFTSYSQLLGVQLYDKAKNVYFTTAIRSAERNADGTIQAIEARRVLIAQDGGHTRAAYWDGETAGHIDPTVVTDDEDNVLTAGTPLGGPMAWSGERLWVARDNKLFACDISDPFSATENQYAGEGGYFAFEDDIVALAPVPSLQNPALLVFTRNRTHVILSGIQARDTWKDTPNFKAVLFPDIGCVSHRSVVSQNGSLWWMTATGLTNLDAAKQANVSTQLQPRDRDLALSKSNLSADLSGTAIGTYENFLLCSVPYSSRFNTHTWVRDEQPTEQESASWAGVWTGTRPVDWVSGRFGGTPRIFHISYDSDERFRLWESFVPDRLDNGNPIECFVESKTHIAFSDRAGGLDRKTFSYAEVTFTDLQGEVDAEVYWAGTKGKYKLIGQYHLEAPVEKLTVGTELDADSTLSSYRPQTRTVRTPTIREDVACSSLGIESKLGDRIDVGFSLLVRWTGRAALKSYRIFADPFEEQSVGDASITEANVTPIAGAICDA